MRKILFLVFALFFLFLPIPKAYADERCTITLPSGRITTDADPSKSRVQINMDSNYFIPGKQYYVWMEGPGLGDNTPYTNWIPSHRNPSRFTVSSNYTISISPLGRDVIGSLERFIIPADYTLKVFPDTTSAADSRALCRASFHVDWSPQYTKYCSPNAYVVDDQGNKITDGTKFTIDTAPVFTANNLTIPFGFAALYQIPNPNQFSLLLANPIAKVNPSKDQLSKGVKFTVGGSEKQTPGYYLAGVVGDVNFTEGKLQVPFCYQIFRILERQSTETPPETTCIETTGCSTTSPTDTQGNCCAGATCIGDRINGTITGGICISSLATLVGGGGGIYQGRDNAPPPVPICKQEGNDYVCDTAVGSISTSPAGFTKTLMSVILSIAGAIAIILIIISGYRMMVSQGDPEKIKDAREQLTAAIIGLLFVIFSLVILQVIGVNILGLPGFK